MPSCKVGWINFESGNSIFVSATQRLQLPLRSALGCNDPDTWVLDAGGRPKDPWQLSHTMSLLLGGEPPQLATFSTYSTGGRQAIGELCKAYGEWLD